MMDRVKVIASRQLLRATCTVSFLALPTACDGASIEVFSIPPEAGAEAAIEPAYASRVDLLLVIDNSPSMADKQTVLALTVPDLVDGLTNPDCLDELGRSTGRPAAGTPCPAGSERAFPPVLDLHIGIISSSLGGHGADSCSNVPTQSYNPRMEDMARLLTTGPNDTAVPTHEDRGFLNWDPAQRQTPPGLSDRDVLTQRFVDLVDGVEQTGCGFESTLESWYRFLVDPAPYERIVPVACNPGDADQTCRAPTGVDDVLLGQRADFLRPDSLLAIVMLSDENDCSVRDGGQYYLALQAFNGSDAFHVAPGTAACREQPNSPECRSCWEVFDPSNHPECSNSWDDPARDDPLNLRCYRQKQRFGIDFLYDTQRYVDALTRTTLQDGSANPLFCGSATDCSTPTRDPTQVVLAGIVGVPWQDIARNPNDLRDGYLSWSEVPWDLVLGDPKNLVEPIDPLMIESVSPRSGVNPPTGAPLAPPATPPGTQGANPINGFERDIPGGEDLQYACIFDLADPLTCTQDASAACDCTTASINPVCWNEATNSFSTTQFRGKAYPGLRHLEVLRSVGIGGVVASICPTQLSNPNETDFGYRPAVRSLLDRMRLNLLPQNEP